MIKECQRLGDQEGRLVGNCQYFRRRIDDLETAVEKFSKPTHRKLAKIFAQQAEYLREMQTIATELSRENWELKEELEKQTKQLASLKGAIKTLKHEREDFKKQIKKLKELKKKHQKPTKA